MDKRWLHSTSECKRFYDVNEEQGNYPYMPVTLRVLQNGMIAAIYSWDIIEVYSPDGGSIIDEYICGRSNIMAVEGNNIYMQC